MVLGLKKKVKKDSGFKKTSPTPEQIQALNDEEEEEEEVEVEAEEDDSEIEEIEEETKKIQEKIQAVKEKKAKVKEAKPETSMPIKIVKEYPMVAVTIGEIDGKQYQLYTIEDYLSKIANE